jgi:lipid-A-disaccharide synthase
MNATRRYRIGVVAGEASGDLLGAHLIEALTQRYGELEITGIAGPRMQAAGASSLFPMEKLALRGYAEVLKSLPELLSIRRKLKAHFLENPPDLFVGIDAPDFNLGLERALKSCGIPTVHFVSPSVWAWRSRRIRKIRRAVSLMLLILPFEEAIYRKANIPAAFVGHPLADALPLAPDQAGAREQLQLPKAQAIFALLPGSRKSEVDFHAELFIRTAQLIHAALPEAQFLVPLITRETKSLFETALVKCDAHGLPLRILFGHAVASMTAADVVLAASGTATLEAALLKRPMVITYKLNPLTAFIVRRRLRLTHVGLPNILAGKELVPELLQENATPEKLAQTLLGLYQDAGRRAAIAEAFIDIHHSLKRNCAQRAAEALAPFLEGGKA